MVTRVVRAIGRRDAMQTLGWVMAAVGLSGLDPDESARLAHAVTSPSRVDAQVVHNLATMLAQLRRQEDTLGAGEVLETAVAQHGLARRLLTGGCTDHWRRPLSRVDSAMASFIGNCLVNMGHPEEASRYLGHARRAGHDAGNAACSLAARTDDIQLKALAETNAAAAYALAGEYGPCMATGDRAHGFLTSAPRPVPDSPASWVHHRRIDSRRSRDLCLLGRPKEALDAAITARTQHHQTSVRYVLCEVRLGHALALSQDITEATHVLGNVADQVHLYPRLTGEFHLAQALVQP